MSAGERNAYYCADCRGYIVTVDRDDGVTPFMLACRVKGEPKTEGNDCEGMMRSMFYPDPPWPERDGMGTPIPTEAAWEFYKPDDVERRELSPHTRDHVQQGGLLLRKIEEPAGE